jgi:hypothetical protein
LLRIIRSMKVDEKAVYGSMDLFLGARDLFLIDP